MGRRRFTNCPDAARHFRLVSRSQNDPLADDPDAPPLVLEPFVTPGSLKRSGLTEDELLKVPKELEEALGPELFGDRLRVPVFAAPAAPGSSEGLEGDCYFPRDGYNYEQHLKRVRVGGGVAGVLLEAPPKLAQELNVKAPEDFRIETAKNSDEKEVNDALEHAEEYEEVEDTVLDALGCALADVSTLWGPTGSLYCNLPDVNIQGELKSGLLHSRVCGAETATSAAADFELLIQEEYGTGDIGACEDIEAAGSLGFDDVDEFLEEYIKDSSSATRQLHSIAEPKGGRLDDEPRALEETKAIIERFYADDLDEAETSSGEEGDEEDPSRTWDCESVLTTLSNLSNRPGIIGRLKAAAKPRPALPPVDEEEAAVELPEVQTTRPKGETAEERRTRKAGVREMRRVCRELKRKSKEEYKVEGAKLQARPPCGDLRSKTRYFKL